MATRIAEAFSISHAAILNGTTGAEEALGDIYGVRSGSLEPDVGEFDNTGDNNVLSAWFWFNYADVTIESGYIPFETIQLITGVTMTSSGVAPNDFYNLPIWTNASLNTPTRPLLIRCPSKDSNGVVRQLDIVLYKVQFKPITFQGPAYKDGLLINYSGRALISSVNEANQALSDPQIGRLISRP